MKSNNEELSGTEPPYKCKICGVHNILEAYEICEICGWEADPIQDANPNYEGGANKLSLNQYKTEWLNKIKGGGK